MTYVDQEFAKEIERKYKDWRALIERINDHMKLMSLQCPNCNSSVKPIGDNKFYCENCGSSLSRRIFWLIASFWKMLLKLSRLSLRIIQICITLTGCIMNRSTLPATFCTQKTRMQEFRIWLLAFTN